MTTVKGYFAETTSVRDQKAGRGEERWMVRDSSTGRFMDVKVGYGRTVNIEADEIVTNSIAGVAGIVANQSPAVYAVSPVEAAPAEVEKGMRRARMKAITKLGMALHHDTLAALAK